MSEPENSQLEETLGPLTPDEWVALGCAAPFASPPAALRDRLLARIRPKDSGFTQPLPGVFVLPAAAGVWKPAPFPGVSYKILHVDRATSLATSLLKLEPGAKYPRHIHTAVEHCLVLEGAVESGDIRLYAGDYERADAGTLHPEIESRGGCLLLIIGSTHDEVLA